MVQKQQSFSESLHFGEDGEREVAKYLINKLKISLLPLFQFKDTENEKSPKIFVHNHVSIDTSISPDLTCFYSGRAFFVEIKTKQKWVHWDGRRETGFNYTHFYEYQKLQQLTGIPVMVIFNHKEEEPTGMYYTKLWSPEMQSPAGRLTRIWGGKTQNGKIIEKKPLLLYHEKSLKKLDSNFLDNIFDKPVPNFRKKIKEEVHWSISTPV